MRTEITRVFPVSLKEGFDYLHDFKLWPVWYVGVLEIIDPEKGAWDKRGDTVRFAYKMLGRRVEGEAIVDEMIDGELVSFTTKVSGLPDVHEEFHYSEVTDDSFKLTTVLETDEPTSFFGKTIDRMVLPRVLERDLRTTMDHLEDIFRVGIPD